MIGATPHAMNRSTAKGHFRPAPSAVAAFKHKVMIGRPVVLANTVGNLVADQVASIGRGGEDDINRDLVKFTKEERRAMQVRPIQMVDVPASAPYFDISTDTAGSNPLGLSFAQPSRISGPGGQYITEVPKAWGEMRLQNPELAKRVDALVQFAEENTFPKDNSVAGRDYLHGHEIAYSVVKLKNGNFDSRYVIGDDGVGLINEDQIKKILPDIKKGEELVAAGHSHNGLVRSEGVSFLENMFGLNYTPIAPGPSDFDVDTSNNFPNAYFFINTKTYGSSGWNIIYYGPKSLAGTR